MTHAPDAPLSSLVRRATRIAPAAALLCTSLAHSLPGQLYAHRTLVPVPLDDTTRAIGFLPAIDYFADVQRSSGSAGDDRAWGIRLAATAEFWRVSRATSVLVSAADEVAANGRSEEHTSELQSRQYLVCRLLL